MTELIDLATLASLGQHFSTLEEVAEMKTLLLTVQSDIALIKKFLFKKHGSDFSNTLSGKELGKTAPPTKNGTIGVPRVSVQTAVETKPPAVKTVEAHKQLAKPPPLQRIAGNNGSSVRTEKFHRNFLSMGSLRNSHSQGTRNRLLSNNNKTGNGSQVGGTSLAKIISARKLPETLKSQQLKNNSFPQPQLKQEPTDIEYYDLTDDVNYAEVHSNGAEGEAYDEAEDEDLGFVPPYEDDEDNNVEEGVYEEDISQLEMLEEEDGTNYDEYSADGLELVDVDGSPLGIVQNQKLPASSNSKAQLRRIPATANGNIGNDTKQCKVCHQLIPAFALFDHVINSHYLGNVPTCKICSKTFTYKQGLISHMRYHDQDKYDKACSYCGKKFIRRSDVVIHERRLHTGERPYHCPVPGCSQGFVRRYCLLTHVKTNHGEPYMSQILSQTNRRKSS